MDDCTRAPRAAQPSPDALADAEIARIHLWRAAQKPPAAPPAADPSEHRLDPVAADNGAQGVGSVPFGRARVWRMVELIVDLALADERRFRMFVDHFPPGRIGDASIEPAIAFLEAILREGDR